MLSRKDVRPQQTQMLLDAGFLPISVDYRLCPERTLKEGPMQDVRDALSWVQKMLPKQRLARDDILADGDHVVAVGWSTGGHLALSLGFTAPDSGIQSPAAILAFYCPSDYEDPFWSQSNAPFGVKPVPETEYDIMEGIHDKPITAYNPPALQRALGGWMAPSDARSRLALHMNWNAKTLPVLLKGISQGSEDANLRLEEIQTVSPLTQIRERQYRTPTFLIHGTKDDLIPWQQAQRTYEALQETGVLSELRILQGAVHLFDSYRGYEKDEEAARVVREGYDFLSTQVKERKLWLE